MIQQNIDLKPIGGIEPMQLIKKDGVTLACTTDALRTWVGLRSYRFCATGRVLQPLAP
jgi:hypothetical protein